MGGSVGRPVKRGEVEGQAVPVPHAPGARCVGVGESVKEAEWVMPPARPPKPVGVAARAGEREAMRLALEVALREGEGEAEGEMRVLLEASGDALGRALVGLWLALWEALPLGVPREEGLRRAVRVPPWPSPLARKAAAVGEGVRLPAAAPPMPPGLAVASVAVALAGAVAAPLAEGEGEAVA